MGKRSEALAAVAGIGEVPTGNYPDRSALEAATHVARMAIRNNGNA